MCDKNLRPISLTGILASTLTALLILPFVGCSNSSSTPPPPPPSGNTNFVYTANAAGTPSTVSVLASSPTTGALSSVSGSPYNTGSSSRALKVDPAGKYVFVANTASGDISAFTINPVNGALSPVAGSLFPVEAGVNGIAIDPTGAYLYAVSGSSANLWEFSIDNSGALHNLATSPVLIDASGSQSGALTIDPSGKFLYVTANAAAGTSIYAFARNTASGTASLIAGAIYSIDLFSNSIITDPSGKFVLAVSNGSSTLFGLIAIFSLDSTTGKLAEVATSPFQTGSDPSSVTVDPSGKFVYVANTSDATISAFTLNTTSGVLGTVAGSPFPSGGHGTINGPLGIVVDAAGKYIYVCNASNDISVFTFSTQTGALTALPGSPFALDGNGPNAIAVVQKQ
jgi:6-phosphogluconolactonase